MSIFFTNEFQPSSAVAWKQKIQFELDGADYNKTLLNTTLEGITIKPFYHVDDFEKVLVPQSNKPFKICKTINITSEVIANSEALKAIEKGITAILFKASKPFNASLLFKDLLNINIEFHFDFNFLSEDFINELCEILHIETFYLNIDPIGNLTKTGNWYSSLNNDFTILESLIKKNPDRFILSVDSTMYQNAGANIVQQIAYALAHANEYFTKFGSEIANIIQFKFATGSNHFFEIAKIRAFRYLYNLILSKYDTTAIAKIYAEPSLRNKTLFGSTLNTFRTISETESAIFGGVDTVSIDAELDLYNKSTSEISKSQQQLLNNMLQFKNQQNFATDSYYIEDLTKQLAEKALTIFKDIEKSGGFLSQLKEGTIQRKITENAKKEQAQFDSEVFLDGTISSTIIRITPNQKNSNKTLIIPILTKRLSEKMEQKIRRDEA